MTIGDRIKERRKKLDMTSDELAAKLGKSRATIYRYENGDIKNLSTTILEPLAEALYTTPAYLMGWTEDPDDWERIVNEKGICPPNNYDGDPEDWYNMKVASTKDHEREEAELIGKFIKDRRFNQLVSSYILLNPTNKDKVVKYTEKLLDIQYMEEQSYLEPLAAHERTDIKINDDMRKNDDDIMNDDEFWNK